MKNLFFAAMAALAMLCSCSKQNDEILKSVKGNVVEVSFVDEPPVSRAFFGTTAVAEAWEKSFSSITLFVFDNSGNLIVQRNFSPGELTAKKATFSVPDVTAGSSCDFYAVANLVPANITNKASLLAVLETTPEQYNGTFAEVSTAAKRAGGFVMSGYVAKTIAAAGSTTDVAITLKRTVAKIAMEITPSSSFGSLYPGAVRVNIVTLKKGASQTPVISPASITPGTMNFTTTQVSNVVSGKYQNLFYLYENGNLAAGSRVTATINATYDPDGNFSTTEGQLAMDFDVELASNSGGAISRNGYYRVEVAINGLSGSDATLTITPAEWETPVTQTVNVGM